MNKLSSLFVNQDRIHHYMIHWRKNETKIMSLSGKITLAVVEAASKTQKFIKFLENLRTNHLSSEVSEQIIVWSKQVFSEGQTSKISVDIAFLIDITGSMGKYINATRDSIVGLAQQIIHKINQNQSEILIRFAAVGYRDYSDGSWRLSTYDFNPDVTLLNQQDEIKSLKSFISLWRATGGEDFPEDVLGGFKKAQELSWNPKANASFIVQIGDAPDHDPRCGGTGHRMRKEKEDEWNETLSDFKKKNIDIIISKLKESPNEKQNLFITSTWNSLEPTLKTMKPPMYNLSPDDFLKNLSTDLQNRITEKLIPVHSPPLKGYKC